MSIIFLSFSDKFEQLYSRLSTSALIFISKIEMGFIQLSTTHFNLHERHLSY